jgi:hypothetical protein
MWHGRGRQGVRVLSCVEISPGKLPLRNRRGDNMKLGRMLGRYFVMAGGGGNWLRIVSSSRLVQFLVLLQPLAHAGHTNYRYAYR